MARARSFTREANLRSADPAEPDGRPDGHGSAARRPRRAALRRAWVLAPLAAALLYAVAWPLVRPRPSLRDLVPAEAVETQRWKDLATFDRVETGDAVEPGTVAPSALLGASINLPGLPGIDRRRPIVGATLSPASRRPSQLFVLPLSDADLARRRFEDPDLVERHAGWLEVHGDHALVGRDRVAVRLAGGRGGVWPDERGEDWARAADWPRFVDFAVRNGREAPFRAILEGIGVDVEHALPLPGMPVPERVSWGRLPDVRDAWTKVSLHGFPDRVRAEFVAAPGRDLARALEEAARAAPDDLPPPLPPFATGPSLRVFGSASRRALSIALRDAGVAFPEGATLEAFLGTEGGTEGGAGAGGGSLVAWAQESPEGWTVVVLGARPPLPRTFGLPEPSDDEPAPYGAGLAPVTAPYGGTPPAGSVARRAVPGARPVAALAIGPAAPAAVLRAVAAGGDGEGAADGDPPPPADGGRTLATFRLPAEAARRLLGPLVEEGGLLFPLAGGDLSGVVSTDGTRIVLDLRR